MEKIQKVEIRLCECDCKNAGVVKQNHVIIALKSVAASH